MGNRDEQNLRVLIVDDERLARENLRDLLGDHPQILVVGEARNAAEAEKMIAAERPDLVFLDIQMPGGSGFDLLARLENPPLIAFVTAYDRFALRAFEVNALDYILKPIDLDRLRKCLRRVGSRIQGRETAGRALSCTDQVFLNTGSKAFFMPVMDIAAIRADGNYTQVIDVRGQRYMIRSSLREWGRRLPDDAFLTLNRSLIINRRHIRRWIDKSRKAALFLQGVPQPFCLGRAGYSRFKKLLGPQLAHGRG